MEDDSIETELGTRVLALVAGGMVVITNNERGDVFLEVGQGQNKLSFQLNQREALVVIEYLAVAARSGSGARIVTAAVEASAALGDGSDHGHGNGLARHRQDSVADIQRAVCAHFNLSVNEMRSHVRVRTVTGPRMIAMYLCRQRLSISYAELGRRFGGRDHTTVMNAVSQVEAKLKEPDRRVLDCVEAITGALDA